MLLRASFIWGCVCVCVTFGISAEWSYEGATITLAHLNVSLVDPISGSIHPHERQIGKYGSGAVGAVSGVLVVGQPKDLMGSDQRHGCTLPWAASPPTGEPWVALVSRGDCSDRDKVANALALNASGVLIYAKDSQAQLQKIAMSTFTRDRSVVVFLAHDHGERLAKLVENGTKVYVSITRGQDVKYRVTNINRQSSSSSKNNRNMSPSTFVALNPVCYRGQIFVDCVIVTSVLFVSVSFIILMIISLAWLIFYYIQRFRYIHAKDRLARHLCNAAKKALSKIPVKNLKSGDQEVTSENDCCAICIEPYQVTDTIRILPCKHQFHKYCVDPWLLEHRTCPMCKMDILKFYGYVFSGSTETVVPMDDVVVFEITLSDSEESVLQVDIAEDSAGADAGEPHAPTPPPPPAANPRGSTISQVMVVPRAEATASDASCEGWSESPVPDMPISPVHQPPVSAALTGSVAGSVLHSVIDSAKTRVIQSAKVSHSSQTPPPSAKSQQSTSSSFSEVDTRVETAEQCGTDTCIQIPVDCDDLEIASVCSEDFMDAQSVEDAALGLSFIAAINPELTGIKSAISRSTLTPCEDTAVHSLQSNSVQSSADMRLSLKTSDSHREATLHPRSTARSRSLSRKRSPGYRSRSASKRRSASHARSSSRSRFTGRHHDSSSSARSGSASHSERNRSRPSSHVVNVSHV